jgi:hypothetical protein
MAGGDRPRWSAVGLAIGLIAVAALAAGWRHPPFQDFPNHLHVLEAARALRSGRQIPSIELARAVPYGYSLFAWFARAVEPCSAEMAIRILLACSAIATPLAVAALARAAGADFVWAAILALPLALSWPLRMGFIAYVVALPCGLGMVAAVLADLARPCAAMFAATAGLAVLAYLGHAFVLVMLLPIVALAWLTIGQRRAQAAVRTAVAILPSLALAAHDVARNMFGHIAETEATWPPSPLQFRTLSQSLGHFLTRSYGISEPAALIWFVPFGVALGALVLRAARADRERPSATATFLCAAATLAALGSLIMPSARLDMRELGERVPVVPMALMTAFAAVGVRGLPRAARLAVAAATLLWLAAGAHELAARSARIDAILGRNPPRLSGRYLTVRVSDCLGLIRFCGHQQRGGYGVQDGRQGKSQRGAASPSQLHGGVQGGRGPAGAGRGQDDRAGGTRSRPDALGVAQLGGTGARGSHEGQDGADDGGARGAGEAPEGESRAAHGA